MRARRIGIVSVLAAVALGSALPIWAGETNHPSSLGNDGAHVSHVVPPPGALHAVLRSDGDRLDGLRSPRKNPATRLLVVAAAWLSGLGLLRPPAAWHRTHAAGANAAVTRLRLVVGLRAPPSPKLAYDT